VINVKQNELEFSKIQKMIQKKILDFNRLFSLLSEFLITESAEC